MNRKNIFTIFGALLLIGVVALGVYFASQAQLDQGAETTFACEGYACGCGKCGCGDDKDITSCVPGNPPPQPPGSGVDETCGGVGKGASRCDGNGKEKRCAGGQMVFTGNCCSGASIIACPPANTTSGSTTAGSGGGANVCGVGSAAKCKDKAFGTQLAIDGGSCACTENGGAGSKICGCIPTAGSKCTNQGSCLNKGIGATCAGNGGFTGTCKGGATGLNSCTCVANNTDTPAPGGGGSGASCATANCATGFYCDGGFPATCVGKKAFGATCGGANQCLSGICTAGKCANAAATTSGSTTAGSGAGSAGIGALCENGVTCQSGLVCQGVNGSRKCQQPTDCADGVCGCSNGGTCTGYITFTCSQLTNGQCHSNPQDGAGSPACGQVDKVWIGGPCNRKLCGDFTIYNNCSGGGTTTPPATTGGTTNPPPPATTGGTTTPPPATPYCGDAVCATGELCEATTPDGTTFKACGTIGSSPTGADVPACYGTNFKAAVTTNTCKWCGDGQYTPGTEQCDPTAPATGGNNPTQCSATCNLNPIANVCVSMTENGVDPIRSGESNFVEYTLIYQHNSTSNPFPNIRLLVSSANTVATAVGRDANNTSSALVAPVPTGGYAYDAVTSRHTYRFRWESTSTGGVAVPDATYQVRGLTDGTNAGIITSPGACTESLTASAVAVEEPLFNVLKTGAVSCVDNSDATINYTVTVRNNGPVTGVIDFVTDTLDPAVIAAGITPTNISPAYGAYASGVITWTGTIGERTFTAGQSKTYTYTVVIPVGQLLNFGPTGVQNLASVQYDTNTTTNNTDSFNLRTQLNCTINGIPVTGIFDDGRLFLFGLIFIMFGFVAYRYQLGKTISEKLISGVVNTAEVGAEKLMPFEERIERKMEKKRKKN